MVNQDYAPGMRTIIRDEEWMVRNIEKNNLGNQVLRCVGISPLVKDKEVIFLTDLEDIKVVNPAEVRLVPDISSHFRRTQLYLESQWRQQIPTDTDLHIGDKAAMDLMPYQPFIKKESPRNVFLRLVLSIYPSITVQPVLCRQVMRERRRRK